MHRASEQAGQPTHVADGGADHHARPRQHDRRARPDDPGQAVVQQQALGEGHADDNKPAGSRHGEWRRQRQGREGGRHGSPASPAGHGSSGNQQWREDRRRGGAPAAAHMLMSWTSEGSTNPCSREGG